MFGHPKGLFILSGTELWERISFHGMQSLLVLYMVEHLLLPGHIERIVGFAAFRHSLESVTGPLSPQALASQIFGLYVGLIYFTPLFGGLLGDRLLGRQRTVILGALLMTAGHFCMAVEQPFLLALLFLILGAGCLRGNLISQVGELYSGGDGRRSSAFQVYYVMLATGAFVAPLICGALAQTYGWHYGFAFAGVGMLVGLCIYLAGHRWVPSDPPDRVESSRAPLSPGERRVVAVLLMILPILALFWIAQAQVWNIYNLWVRDHVDLSVRGWMVPVPWLQAFDALSFLLVVPPVLSVWRWQARRSKEPDDITKLAIGCLIFAAAMLWLAAISKLSNAGTRVPLAFALVFHVVSSLGYSYFAPLAIAFFARTAPAGINALMVGVYYLAMFAGSAISGRLGGLYEQISAAKFWILHAAIVGTGGLLILLLTPALRRALTPRPA
jgi:POT family proton-dependent oligopeptide transporter